MHRPRPLASLGSALAVLAAVAALATPACHGCAGNGPKLSPPSTDWIAGRLPAAQETGTPRRGGTLTIRAYYEPSSLNPLTAGSGMASWIVLHHVTQALVRRDPYDDPGYRILPELATRWTVSKDQRTWTFHLRRGVRFDDGTRFTAADVAATFAKLRDPTVKAFDLRPLFQLLDKVVVVDRYTVRLVWKQPYAFVLDAVAQVPIQPAHVIASLTGKQYDEAATNPLDRHPVGTGPFSFVRWDPRQRVVLKRNPGYWGRKAYVDRVIYRIVPDNEIAHQLALRGDLDISDPVQPPAWDRLTRDRVIRRRYHRVLVPETTYVFVGWNTRRPFFKDPRVRRALAMLFPARALRRDIERGLVRPSTCPFYQFGPDCDPKLKPIPHDPARAMKLLAAAGWTDHDGDGTIDKDGVPFRFSILIYPSSRVSVRIATLMKDSYARAGIDVEIQQSEWSSIVTRYQHGEFDATALAWDPGPRSDPTPSWATSSIKAGSNYFAYADPVSDALMDEARRTLDPSKRHALYRKLDDRIFAAQPVDFLYVASDPALVSRRLRGVKPSIFWWQPEDIWFARKAAPPAPSRPRSAPGR